MDIFMWIIIILLFVGFFGGCIAMMVHGLKMSKKQEYEHQKYLAHISGTLKHIEGLPIASGILVNIFYGQEKITFKKDQQEISLDCNKIISIDTCTGRDVKNQVATGAVAGKYIFGGLGGAAVGTLLTTHIYFIITYKKDEENKFIILDTASSGIAAQKIVKDFKKNHYRETEQIEL